MIKYNGQDYIIGLDIGTNSCGWVATDMNNNIFENLHGKTAIGSHLFEEGHSAAGRRQFRTTRRRLARRKWRLKFLEEIFNPEMTKIDPYFFARLKESSLSPKDARKRTQAIVFPTSKKDHEFYMNYPTVYHLRSDLMNIDKKFDLREIFIAIHHIVKYRGNFLQNTPVKSFNASKIDVKCRLRQLNTLFGNLDETNITQFNLDNADQIEQIIKDQTLFKLDKQQKISKLLITKVNNKIQNKRSKDISKQITNAILGYKTRFEVILGIEINKNDKNSWEFRFGDVDADDKLDNLLTKINERQQGILNSLQDFFGAITLLNLVDEGKTLSESMVRKYNDHKKNLKLLKTVEKSQTNKSAVYHLKAAYDLYINNRHANLLKAKKILGVKKTLNKDEFYKFIEKNLDNSAEAQKIKERIKLGFFMPKQRTNQNGVIPYQLHQIELDKIIKNQSKYYPFLAEKNPVKEHRTQAPYKLDELVRFRVPYYVGPMVDNSKVSDKAKNEFAWMIRKQKGQITPWNFNEKVDQMASANKFIKRMTTKDTYLFGEDVLPANSLIYQRFTVLNELNNIRINDQKLDVKLKQDIFKDLFENYTIVTAKKLKDYLRINTKLVTIDLKGLTDNKNGKFNSSLSTYNRLRETGLFDKQLNNLNYQKDLENIIEWNTIFEDKSIFIQKLKEISWVNPRQIDALSKLRFQGWGRLSQKLLFNLYDHNGQNIMARLWDSQNNFMQIVNDPDFKAIIEKTNQKFTKSSDLEDILAEAYISPANKKAIRQVIKVVADIVKAAKGKLPKQIAIEFARNSQKKVKISESRNKKLNDLYKQVDDIVDPSLKNMLLDAEKSKKLVKDKYYLYFRQLGYDAYTGKKINIDNLYAYDLDHILPQAFLKDDSLDNRVLVLKPINSEKSNNVPYKEAVKGKVPAELFANKSAKDIKNMTIKDMWEMWQKRGLISKRKLYNLETNPSEISKYTLSGFINRQLVETSQIIKLVANILQAKYPETEIIEVKADSNHILRKRFNLYKSREVNDYHHAIDAYLTVIVANLLYQTNPDLRPFFVYEKYKKFTNDPNKEKKILNKYKRQINFLWPLTHKYARGEKDNIYIHGTKKVVFTQHDIIQKLKYVYNLKYMLVSRQTITKKGSLYGQTLYPISKRDVTKTRNLIPKAKGMSVDIYGGYSSNNDAYMAIIRIDKKRKFEYKVVGVPMSALSKLNSIKSKSKYKAVLKQYLKHKVLFNKNGKRKRGIKDFEIIKGRVPYQQLIKDGDKKFLLGSSAYVYNAKQLTLSSNSMRVITDNIKMKENEDSLLISVYDEILRKVDKYLPLYDINQFRKKLHIGREKFIALTTSDKREDIIQILNGLHDNAVCGNLKNIGFSTPFGKMQINSGIVLSPHSQLIYQSPTALFEKHVKITNL